MRHHAPVPALSVLALSFLALSVLSVVECASLAREEIAVRGLVRGLKENLDLPCAGRGEEEEEEDAPETIELFGMTFEADGIFYVVDRSGNVAGTGEFELVKREIVANISQFSKGVEFGVVFFDHNVDKWPLDGWPARAGPATKAAATVWVQGKHGGSGTCPLQGIVAAVELANKSSARRKIILYVGDGGGTCRGVDENEYLRQTLDVVRAWNRGGRRPDPLHRHPDAGAREASLVP